MLRIPLAGVLAGQVLVVIAAFVAVILVLSEQQRKEFKSSLFEQLSLRQTFVLLSITNPIVKKMEQFDSYYEHYVTGFAGSGEFASPSDDPETYSLDAALPFYNHFYILPRTDPSILMIVMNNMSTVAWKPYENLTPPVGTFNVWVLDPAKFVVIANETAIGCIGSYPLRTPETDCYAVGVLPYPTKSAWEYVGACERSYTILGNADVLEDPLNGRLHVASYIRAFENKYQPSPSPFVGGVNKSLLLFSMLMNIEHITPFLYKFVTLPSSRSAVFSQEYNGLEFKGYSLISAVKDWSDFNDDLFAKTGSYAQSRWMAGATPDPVLNAVYEHAKDMFIGTTDSGSFEITHDGTKYVCSVGRIYQPRNDLHWIQLEYTPREDFFGVSDRARMIGIVIGSMGALAVLLVCLAIWVAIQLPLKALHASMGLAADMRNDEVVESSPLLSEINDLNEAFKSMNEKLLAARPFLPQSLLRTLHHATTSSEDEAAETPIGTDDEGDCLPHTPFESGTENGTSYAGSNFERRTATIIHHSLRIGSKNHGGGSTTAAVRMMPLNKGLEHKRVAILSINVLGYHDFLSAGAGAGGLSRVSTAHSELARLVEGVVGKERGIVDYFHGDRFVCGFNTARSCGNPVRNGAEAATNLWDRFLASEDRTASNSRLAAAFPHGLAMGLGVGRAYVGNHGTDTMQRLATMGAPFSEAMRLQEVMSRKVLIQCDSQKRMSNMDAAQGAINPLIVGRCLVMGRTIQDLEASKVYCQIVGAVKAAAILSSVTTLDRTAVSNFARTRNAEAMRMPTNKTDQLASVTGAENHTPCGSSTVLVASVVSTSAVKKALAHQLNTSTSNNRQWYHTKAPQKTAAEEADEWLYELQNEVNGNPFTSTNMALYHLWVNGKLPDLTPRLSEVALVGKSVGDNPSRSASQRDFHIHVDAADVRAFSPNRTVNDPSAIYSTSSEKSQTFETPTTTLERSNGNVTQMPRLPSFGLVAPHPAQVPVGIELARSDTQNPHNAVAPPAITVEGFRSPNQSKPNSPLMADCPVGLSISLTSPSVPRALAKPKSTSCSLTSPLERTKPRIVGNDDVSQPQSLLHIAESLSAAPSGTPSAAYNVLRIIANVDTARGTVHDNDKIGTSVLPPCHSMPQQIPAWVDHVVHVLEACGNDVSEARTRLTFQ